MKRLEQQIQRAVFQHLAARSMPGVFAFHPFSGGKRSPIEAAIYKGLGARAGLPDVVIFYRSQIFGLELKSTKGRLTPLQRQTMNEMEIAGARVAVAKSLDEALVTLEFWGVIRRETNGRA